LLTTWLPLPFALPTAVAQTQPLKTPLLRTLPESVCRRGSPGLSPDPLSLPSAISTAATSSRSLHLHLHHPPTNLHAFSAPLVPNHHAPSPHRGGQLDSPSLSSLPLPSLSLSILPSSFLPCNPQASRTLAHPLSLSRARWGLRLPALTCPKGATYTHSRARQRCTQPLTQILESQCPGIFCI